MELASVTHYQTEIGIDYSDVVVLKINRFMQTYNTDQSHQHQQNLTQLNTQSLLFSYEINIRHF